MNPAHNDDQWWEESLILIKHKGDFGLSKEMNWIAKQIIAWYGYEKLNDLTNSISEQLYHSEDELLR